MSIWAEELAMAEGVPPVLPEKHAWLHWDGVGHPTAAGRPIPASHVEPATVDGYVWWLGWEAHIPLETGVTCVLWGPSAGWCAPWRRKPGHWSWSPPSLMPMLFVPDERERLHLAPRVEPDGRTVLATHSGCEGLDCPRFLYGLNPTLYADEDLWMYLGEWSRWPIVGSR